MTSSLKIVVQFAVKAEQNCLRWCQRKRRWRKRTNDDCRCENVISVLSGMGTERARQSASEAIERHQPDVLISAGFCGGLSPELKTGNVVTPNWIENGTGEGVDVDVRDSIRELSSQAKPKLLTVDVVLHSITQKKDAFQQTGCDIVDMESFAIAEICQQQGIQFIPLRVVFDPHDFCIPSGITNTLDETGNPDWQLLLLPRSFQLISSLDVIRMASKRRAAGKSLTKTLCTVITLLQEEQTSSHIEQE